jgi:hypothetical protein
VGPLSLAALAEAVRLDLDSSPEILASPTAIVGLLSPLVVVREGEKSPLLDQETNGGVVTLVHATLRDFLLHGHARESGVSDFSITQDEAHGSIAERCLDYILQYMRSKDRRQTAQDLDQFPLLQYACRHWTTHAQLHEDGTGTTRKAVVKLATDMLCTQSLRDGWLLIFDPLDPAKPAFTPPRSGTPLLHYAVESGLSDVVNHVLSENPDVTAVDGEGRQALHLSVGCISPNRAIIADLLRNGAPTTAKALDGQVPLLIAAHANDVELTKLLFAYTSIEELCHELEDGSTLVHNVASKAPGRILRIFVAPSDQEKPAHITFETAASRSSSHSVGVNLRDGAGCSLLHVAIASRNDEAIKVLINAGADLNVRNLKKDTPLHFAALYNEQAAVDLLINSGADPFRENVDGKTPLQLAWANKALDWQCYEYDYRLTTERQTNTGSQAECQVLKRIKECPGPEVRTRSADDVVQNHRNG